MSISTTVPTIIQPDDEIVTKKRRLEFFIWEPVVAGLLIFPLSLIFWQSAWNFTVECLSTPLGQHPAALLVLYLISQFIFLLIYLNNNHVYDFLVKQKRPYISYALLQLYTFVNGVNYVVQWTTIWIILDTYTGEDWVIMLISSVAAVFILIAMMGHPCDLVCAPFVISYDSIEYNVRISMVFNTDHISDFSAKFISYILYEHIILILSTEAWRGSYKALDILVYPDDVIRSGVVCVLIGYLLYFILMYTQRYSLKMPYFAAFLETNCPALLENIRHFVCFVSCVLIWRGFWVLFDEYLAGVTFPTTSQYILCITYLFISFFLLLLIRSASSINGPMSPMNDEYNLFPLYPNCYLEQWFGVEERSKTPSMVTITSF